MSDINALQARITAALDRIRAGLDAIPSAEAAQDGKDLEIQLAEEKTANAQLVARVEALKERQDGRVAELEAQVSAQAQHMAALDAELQKLRASNADMRDVNAQLRSAAADGVANAELINRAMMAEIDALHAQRGADRAEVDAIIAELSPYIGGAENAAG